MTATTRAPLAASYETHVPALYGMVNPWERRMR
jgi:hypothetical protein